MSIKRPIPTRSPSRSHRLGLILATAVVALPGFAADSLDHWAIRNSGVTRDLNGVAWGNGRYVCVGAGGTIVTSTNGAAWQNANPPVSNDLFDVTYAGGTFVAVGAGGVVLSSTNGLYWMIRSLAITNRLNAVGFGGGLFVAVGASAAILVSADGVGWSRVETTLGGELTGIAYGKGTFVAVGNQSHNPQIVLTSTNGTTWRDLTSFQKGVAGYGVAFGNNLFLELDARSAIYGSSDASTWKQFAFSAGGSSYLYGATCAQGTFVAVGGAFSGPSRKIVTSADGVAWKLRLADSAAPGLRAVGYGNGYFIAVGMSGSILQSDPIFTLTACGFSTNGLELELAGEAGGSYVIQTLADAAQAGWVDLLTVTNRTGTVRFTDAAATSVPMRLYRACGPTAAR